MTIDANKLAGVLALIHTTLASGKRFDEALFLKLMKLEEEGQREEVREGVRGLQDDLLLPRYLRFIAQKKGASTISSALAAREWFFRFPDKESLGAFLVWRDTPEVKKVLKGDPEFFQKADRMFLADLAFKELPNPRPPRRYVDDSPLSEVLWKIRRAVDVEVLSVHSR